MTVRENLEIGMYRKWPLKPGALDPAFDLFPELSVLIGRLAYSLSGGEQQMVALARAFLPDPDVVMLDEPSLGLAPVVATRILQPVDDMREAGKEIHIVWKATEVDLACGDRGDGRSPE